MNPLMNARIILGVTGSIACYKAVDLASKLAQAGAEVDTILTSGATRFVTPLTFQSVTGRRAYTDADLWGSEAHVLHVGLGHEADLLIIAPATANTLAKLAQGQADNLLTVTALAATCPQLLAPAMDGGMFTHPATAANVATLNERGAVFVGPEEGHLASGLVAMGRMSEPARLLGEVRLLLSRQNGPLTGRKIVVTAGGTREPIDPVRYLTNRSSGKQGYALAQAALDAGADGDAREQRRGHRAANRRNGHRRRLGAGDGRRRAGSRARCGRSAHGRGRGRLSPGAGFDGRRSKSGRHPDHRTHAQSRYSATGCRNSAKEPEDHSW